MNPPDLQTQTTKAAVPRSSKARKWIRIFLIVLLGVAVVGAIYWVKKGVWRFPLTIIERRVEGGKQVFECEFANRTTSPVFYLGPFARPVSSLVGNPRSGVPSGGNWGTLQPGEKIRVSAEATTPDGKPFDGPAAVGVVAIEMPAANQIPDLVHGLLPSDWHLGKSVIIVTVPKGE